MKCVKCGNELEAGARFCGSCGTLQPNAVIPQAATRSNAKTLFQGSGAGAVPVIKPPSQQQPAPPAPSPSKPVASPVGYAATIMPGSDLIKPVPSPSKPQPSPS